MTKNIEALRMTLKKTAVKVLKCCAVEIQPNGRVKRPYRVRVPSGDMKYPSFWIRDAAMMAESGLIEPDEIWDWIELICLCGQNGSALRELEHGLCVPPWGIPDHINCDGGAVFFPGTYQSGGDQGDGRYGAFPPHDDAYYFIDMIDRYCRLRGSDAAQILRTPVGGAPLIERAVRAYESGRVDAKTGLCMSQPPRHTVDWGFCDAVVKSGLLLFPSLLRMRAARQLSGLTGACGNDAGAHRYEELAGQLRISIAGTFATPEGWLLSATEKCRQPDVWGTAFAVWNGALAGDLLHRALDALAAAYAAGTVCSGGYVRHIPTNRDYSESSAWEGTDLPAGDYQNGGYWATPTGWYAYALSLTDRVLAERLLSELTENTAVHSDAGAPWEWKNADDTVFSGCLYGTSAALPYAGAARIASEAVGHA